MADGRRRPSSLQPGRRVHQRNGVEKGWEGMAGEKTGVGKWQPGVGRDGKEGENTVSLGAAGKGGSREKGQR